MSQYPNVEAGLQYCRDVVEKRIIANEYVRLRCLKTLQEIDGAEDEDSECDFRPDLAERFMVFAQKFENIKGKTGGQKLQLLPWQQGAFTALFGITEKGTSFRKYKVALIFAPKGNGKTFIQAPTSLYCTFAEGEPGADGFASAQTSEQARLLFDVCKEMVLRSPAFRKKFGVEVKAHAIYQPKTASTFKPISSSAKSLQGKSVAFGCIDEIASATTDDVYQSLRTAMQKRDQPLLMCCSTAGSNEAAIGKQLWDYGVEVLEEKKVDQTLFALIYCADKDDDLWQESTWKKANPSWEYAGVDPKSLRSAFQQARNSGALESGCMTFHLNKWVGANSALFNTRAWTSCGDKDLKIEQFKGKRCHIGLDLASKTDLAGLSIVFPTYDKGVASFAVFTKAYLNEDAILSARNAAYPGWLRDGHLIETPGNVTDFGWIEADILELCKDYDVQSLAFDPWQATQISQRLMDQGVNCVEFRANVQNFSEPTKELDAAVRSGRIKHDGNPVLAWCISNVVGHYDARDNVYPRKGHANNKIDLAIATIMAIAECLFGEKQSASVYETRGIRLLG